MSCAGNNSDADQEDDCGNDPPSHHLSPISKSVPCGPGRHSEGWDRGHWHSRRLRLSFADRPMRKRGDGRGRSYPIMGSAIAPAAWRYSRDPARFILGE